MRKSLVRVDEIQYVVRITAPLIIDGDASDEIFAGRDGFDSDNAAIRRWLGGKISHAEDALNDSLPDGWNVTVEAVVGS